MSEMLANHYFMVRNYLSAQEEYEAVLSKMPDNKNARKRLVICYTQTGRVKQAIQLFNELIAVDINFIIDTNPVRDDCPCPELIEKIEARKGINTDTVDFNLIMGIIWLYCDAARSIEFFLHARELSPDDISIDTAINAIHDYLDSRNLAGNAL
ncbi:MAG: tetratricopeptide repeat protein [Syntrophothermus sp.]